MPDDRTMRERIARAVGRGIDILDPVVGDVVEERALFDAADAVLDELRDPDGAMIEAAANTPGMKAVSAAMQVHQARGYDFPAGSFDDGSPLHQAWRAAIDAAKQ